MRVDTAAYAKFGFCVATGLLPRDRASALAQRVAALVRDGSSEHVQPGQFQTQYDKSAAVAQMKINQVTEVDPVFRGLSHDAALVDGVEACIGAGARVFRDVLIVKPAASTGALGW